MMKRILFALIALLLIPCATLADKLSVDSIPLPLREDAAVVVRSSQMVYTVESLTRAKASFRQVITLMNESADNLRVFPIYYDSFRSVQRINASVYDADGRFIEPVPASRILDVSAGSGFISDARAKLILFPVNRYPFTIEVEYDVVFKGWYMLPGWPFQSNPYFSVEESGVQYVIPGSFPFRYREKHMSASFDSIRQDDRTIYTWTQRNIPAIKRSYFSPLAIDRLPELLVATDDFEFGGIRGSLRSWESLGEWAWKLNLGLDQLGDAEKRRVAGITSGLTDDREKVEALYRYMQSRTRYTSIQLGIGGLKPAPASEVSEKGYGDCKGLTNYMSALLKEAGIVSYYTWVRSGANRSIDPTFVSHQFDHAILCVPLRGDTVWLECTSQTIPFNYLGSFTSDRDVLLITPDGGRLARTPAFRNSFTNNVATISIGRREPTKGSFTLTSGGVGFDNYRNFNGKDIAELRRMLNSGMELGTYITDTASYREYVSDEPLSAISFELTLNDFSVVTGRRIHFRPCLSPSGYQPFDSISLKVFEISEKRDSIIYRVPAGYRAEYIPEAVVMEGEYGAYSFSVVPLDDGSLLFTRRMKINRGTYTGERAAELFAFLNRAAASDQRRVYLIRD